VSGAANAYALVLAVLVITAGRLGDLLGPRTMFVAGIAVFTVASPACGFAPNAGWLIAFRAVQGLGRLGTEVFGQGYVLAMRWTMVLPITVVALAAASCLLVPNKASGQGPVTVTDAEPGQMAGTISSPGSSGSAGQSPGSSSGMTS